MPDVIDADYVEVAAEERQSWRPGAGPPAAAAPVAAGMAMLAKGGGAHAQARARGGPLFWTVGALAVATAFWVSGGHVLLRQNLPEVRVISPRLQIGEVRSRAALIDGATALLVDGEVRNAGQAVGRIPGLAIRVTSMGREVTTYRLGTSDASLAPGSKYRFSSRLDMPKDGVKTVSVAFDE